MFSVMMSPFTDIVRALTTFSFQRISHYRQKSTQMLATQRRQIYHSQRIQNGKFPAYIRDMHLHCEMNVLLPGQSL